MNARALFAAATLPLFVLLLVQAGMAERDERALWRGEMFGPDSYMRLVRVAELHEADSWYDGRSRRNNTPFGERLHWTRPMDLVLLAGATLATPLVGFEAALHWWGVAVGPLVHVLSLLALMWAAWPLLGPRSAVWLGLLFPFQLVLTYQFAAARPDHHGLISLALISATGLAIRVVGERPSSARAREATLAGVAVALGVWVSVESLVPAALVGAVLTIAWLIDDGAYARLALLFATAATATLVAGLMVEYRPLDLFAVHYDTLSIVHVALFAAFAAFWLAVLRAERHTATFRARLVASTVAGVLGLLAIRTLFVNVLDGPLAEMDPRLDELWFRHIREIRPLLTANNVGGGAARFATHMGPAVLALPYLAWLIYQSDGARRRGWLVVALGMALTVPLSFHQIRWTAHAQVYLLLPYAALVGRLAERTDHLNVLSGGLIRSGLLAVFAFGFLIVGSVLEARIAREEPETPCHWLQMAAFLDQRYDEPQRIGTFIFRGPELLYGSRHAVVAGPYHRNAEGIIDIIDMFSATQMSVARAIVEKRGLDLLLACTTDREAADYRRGDGDSRSLLDRIESADAPPWLAPIVLPADLAGNFALYGVR